MAELAFLHPLFLTALLGLPVLWWLLRAVPPPPRRMVLPTFLFLQDLKSPETTPQTLPWWLLLIRIFLIATIILALAEPIWRPAAPPTAPSLRLVIDNSWAAAPSWNVQQQEASRALARAKRAGQSVWIVSTAAPGGQVSPIVTGPLSAEEARIALAGLAPQPWPADLENILSMLKQQKISDRVETVWLGHGVREQGFDPLIKWLNQHGPLAYYAPPAAMGPLVLQPDADADEGALQFTLERRLPVDHDVAVPLILFDREGRLRARQLVTFPADYRETTIKIAPENASPEIQGLRVETLANAGGTFLFDGLVGRRRVAIVGLGPSNDTAPLTNTHYYLTRALEPYADLSFTSLQEALDQNPDLILAPDMGDIGPAANEKLLSWVEHGGTLLRFAGPATAETHEQDLLPVRLHVGERALSGLASWATPPKIAPFPPDSPLASLTPPTDLNIRQQVLAEPRADLDQFVWAGLSDGTPLITARSVENGRIVLVHVSAGPEWSDLPLSGFYVSFFKRVLALTGQHISTSSASSPKTEHLLSPAMTLDGYGLLQPAPAWAHAIKPDQEMISSATPPGLYGTAQTGKALNLGPYIHHLDAATNLPHGVSTLTYGDSAAEKPLKPFLLTLLLVLLIADGIALLVLQGLRWSRLRPKLAAMIVLLLLFPPIPTYAADQPAATLSEQVHIAYLATGDAAIDQTTKTGLETLTEILRQRTAIDMGSPVAVRFGKDDLSFFPLLYWPIGTAADTLSNKETDIARYYLQHGGMILFDTRDESTGTTWVPTQNSKRLQTILNQLNIGALKPVHDDHVLLRSFYLLPELTGKNGGPTLWLEQQTGTGNDGVSSIIVSSQNWPQLWGAAPAGHMILSSPRREEIAWRFGVNLVMYALTGNYKTDQVHIPFILRRLDNRPLWQDLP